MFKKSWDIEKSWFEKLLKFGINSNETAIKTLPIILNLWVLFILSSNSNHTNGIIKNQIIIFISLYVKPVIASKYFKNW